MESFKTVTPFIYPSRTWMNHYNFTTLNTGMMVKDKEKKSTQRSLKLKNDVSHPTNRYCFVDCFFVLTIFLANNLYCTKTSFFLFKWSHICKENTFLSWAAKQRSVGDANENLTNLLRRCQTSYSATDSYFELQGTQGADSQVPVGRLIVNTCEQPVAISYLHSIRMISILLDDNTHTHKAVFIYQEDGMVYLQAWPQPHFTPMGWSQVGCSFQSDQQTILADKQQMLVEKKYQIFL